MSTISAGRAINLLGPVQVNAPVVNATANPSYVVTIIGSNPLGGFSERYVSRPESNLNALAQDITTLVQYRQVLSGPAINFLGIRVSQFGSLRQSFVMIPPNGIIPGADLTVPFSPVGLYTPVSYNTQMSELRVSANYKVNFGAGRTTTRYLAGVPIGIMTGEAGSFNFNNNPQWFTNFNLFAGNLVGSGWSIIGQLTGSAATYYPIAAVQVGTQTPPLLGLNISNQPNGLPTLIVGQRIAVQGMRPAKFTRGPTINGTWSVYSVDTVSAAPNAIVYLQNSTGIAPAIMRTTGKSVMRVQTFTTFPITSINLYRIGIKKRGRPTIQYRGRRLSRPTLDP